MKKHKEKIKGSIKRNIDIMNTPLMSILPGQISFFTILSIIPLASLLFMFISKLSFNFESITGAINHYLPEGVSSLLLTIFDQQKVGAIDVFFIVAAFYLAAKATHSIIIASTQIYNGKQKDFLSTRIKAIIMLAILIILALILLTVLTLGSRFMTYLTETYGAITPFMYWTYMVLRWPVVIFIVFMAVKTIYTIAPNVSIPSRSVNKGALITTIGWFVVTFIYSFYVNNLANFSKFYGNLSNLIISFIYIYWLSYIFVFGMTFNEYRLSNKGTNIKSLD